VTDERRRYPRSTVRLQAVEHRGNERLPRMVTSLSAGGFFVEEAGAAARLGELRVVEFSGRGGAFRVTAEVVYVTAEGVGMRVTRADWERLWDLLAET
jgi:hypothetical protein